MESGETPRHVMDASGRVRMLEDINQDLLSAEWRR